MLELLIQANNLSLEYRTISEASRRNPADDELAMMLVDSQSACSSLENELSDDAQWATKHSRDCSGSSEDWSCC